jgi:hypothetical protein
MRAWVMLFLPCVLAAQSPGASPPVVRGVLLERDAQAAGGEFSVRVPDNRVFRYQFDRKTYVERDGQVTDVARLNPGEKVEVVSDTLPGLVLRYARTVHVLEDPPPRRAQSQGRPRAYRDPVDREIPASNVTYAGVVARLSADRLVLHTRSGDQTIRLREDTQYLENGELVAAAALKSNMRVAVRAAKNLYDELVGYQVIWGQILDPDGR